MGDGAIMSAVFVGVIAGFYLMFMRPVQKDQEKHKKNIRDLRIGDEVLTTSGFIARVRDIRVPETGQTRLSLELADGVVFEAVPSAILERLTPGGETMPSEQKEASA
jgi:preprotein translocase subunit YajC